MKSALPDINSPVHQVQRMRGYYKFHARLYQASRWTFLFGRSSILRLLKLSWLNNSTLLEVGCGTGHNLKKLCRSHPNMSFIGLDVSPEMLSLAQKRLAMYENRIKWLEIPYGPDNNPLPNTPDIILFSYCLTMINPGWETAIERAYADLNAGGRIAVVDFHQTPSSLFRHWMGYNHVRMDNHLLPILEKHFSTVKKEIHPAYGGLWSYFLYVGKK